MAIIRWGVARLRLIRVVMRGSVSALPRPETDANKKPKGLGGEYQIAAGNAGWRIQFRPAFAGARVNETKVGLLVGTIQADDKVIRMRGVHDV